MGILAKVREELLVGDTRQCAAFELTDDPVRLVLRASAQLRRNKDCRLRFRVRRDGTEGEITVKVDSRVWNHRYTRAKGLIRLKGDVVEVNFPEELPRAHTEYKHASVELGPSSTQTIALSI